MNSKSGQQRVALDSSAMIAFLSGEPGGDVVRGLLGNRSIVSAAHAVNLCEVYYDALRLSGAISADNALKKLRADGV